MSDYINRISAINAVFESHIHFNEYLRVTERINAIPAADVVEIEPGAWILTDFDGNTMKIKEIQRERIEVENETERKKGAWIPLFPIVSDRPYGYECSSCGFTTGRMTNFCQNCGADLRKDGDT